LKKLVTSKKFADKRVITRREVRIKVMQACYAAIIGELPTTEVYNSLLRADVTQLRDAAKDLFKQQDALKKEAIAEGASSFSVPDNRSEVQEIIDLANFFAGLFEGTLQNRERYEAIIDAEVTNRATERIVPIDKILVMLGLQEFLYFPTIPVKVTINEYIEIAKDFSTEKSNIFVNGLLDKLCTRFMEEGLIQKQGRGLVQNNSQFNNRVYAKGNNSNQNRFKNPSETVKEEGVNVVVEDEQQLLNDKQTKFIRNVEIPSLTEVPTNPLLQNQTFVKKRKRLLKNIPND